MFEKECETEEVDDDLPATERFVSPQKSLATYNPDEACPDAVLFCDSSSEFTSCVMSLMCVFTMTQVLVVVNYQIAF